MNHLRFDDVTRRFSRLSSRRHLLGGLASGILGLGAGQLADLAIAKKKRKGKRRRVKKAQPNEFGCIEVSDPCSTAGDCCSGICEGNKGKRRCKAHDTGGCVAGSAFVGCGGSTYVDCATSLGGAGVCATATGNAGYCLHAPASYPCQTDHDCKVVAGGMLGPRAACIRCTDGIEGSICATVDRIPT
jgi:hypothetical protein